MGLTGLWLSKLAIDSSILLYYAYLLYYANWRIHSRKSIKRQLNDVTQITKKNNQLEQKRYSHVLRASLMEIERIVPNSSDAEKEFDEKKFGQELM